MKNNRSKGLGDSSLVGRTMYFVTVVFDGQSLK